MAHVYFENPRYFIRIAMACPLLNLARRRDHLELLLCFQIQLWLLGGRWRTFRLTSLWRLTPLTSSVLARYNFPISLPCFPCGMERAADDWTFFLNFYLILIHCRMFHVLILFFFFFFFFFPLRLRWCEFDYSDWIIHNMNKLFVCKYIFVGFFL